MMALVTINKHIIIPCLSTLNFQSMIVDRWFSPGTPVSFTNKTNRHDITDILLNTLDHKSNLVYNVFSPFCTSEEMWYWQLDLKVALSTITFPLNVDKFSESMYRTGHNLKNNMLNYYRGITRFFIESLFWQYVYLFDK